VVIGGLGAIGRMRDEGICSECGCSNSCADGAIVADGEAACTAIEW
jgi:hypothetical protein